MRLWTWQKKGFLLDSDRVESLRNSAYLNDFSRAFADRLMMLKAYVKFWELLDTDQILWCFTDKKEAVNANGDSWCAESQLWEIEVPDDKVKLICGVGWHWMLAKRECAAPSRFEDLFVQMMSLLLTRYNRDVFFSDFNAYWANKTDDELARDLLVQSTCYGCAQAVVFHPIDRDWIVNGPIGDGG